ncbi:MAG TPA: AAA family ATPase [Pirellulales bacterium]|nr:AAA family ATPase [Pirellulales bacterium]
MAFLKSIRLAGFLSYSPDAPAIDLAPLNVLIGPNASGKSNLIEAIELLRAAPTAFAAAIRDGGGAREWLWKGDRASSQATVDVVTSEAVPVPDLRYFLTFTASGTRTEILDEAIEETEKRFASEKDVYFYYRFQHGRPVLNTCQTSTTTLTTTTPGPTAAATANKAQRTLRQLARQSLIPDESVLSQRKDPELYPELYWLGSQFALIQTFREWSFGRYVALRQPQPADLPTDVLLPDSRNLGLLLNALEHTGASQEFNRLLVQFLPRYVRFSTLVQGGTVQFYLHESGLKAPIPATRLSDGTIRFVAMLALLMSPAPPPLLCIEEPELGLHPDAIGLLADLFVSASTRSQLIVTTHSDTLVSALTDEANSVVVCDYRGGTVLQRVDAAELDLWLDKYRLGEVWRIGELGGNP